MAKIRWEKLFLTLGVIFLAIILFTAIDYLVHTLSEEYAVPGYYFTNKIIFGTIIACIAYYFVRKRVFWQKSLAISVVTAVLLQTKYFLQGYSLEFVFEFLVLHFFMLLASSMILFYVFRKNV